MLPRYLWFYDPVRIESWTFEALLLVKVSMPVARPCFGRKAAVSKSQSSKKSNQQSIPKGQESVSRRNKCLKAAL